MWREGGLCQCLCKLATDAEVEGRKLPQVSGSVGGCEVAGGATNKNSGRMRTGYYPQAASGEDKQSHFVTRNVGGWKVREQELKPSGPKWQGHRPTSRNSVIFTRIQLKSIGLGLSFLLRSSVSPRSPSVSPRQSSHAVSRMPPPFVYKRGANAANLVLIIPPLPLCANHRSQTNYPRWPSPQPRPGRPINAPPAAPSPSLLHMGLTATTKADKSERPSQSQVKLAI